MSRLGTIASIVERGSYALVGASTPVDQIAAGVVCLVWILATSAFGWVVDLVLLPIPIAAIAIGTIRLFPPVERRWPIRRRTGA